MKKIFSIPLVLFALLTSCKNQEWEFPDYIHQTVYFAYQGPVRTITLGEDIVNTSLDNEHKFEIMATAGGAYTTKEDITIDVAIDNSLTQGLLFGNGGDEIVAMPSNYYTLASDKIIIPKGKITGGVQVQLTDAFFADPLALKKTYVVPLAMKSVKNADSLLAGKSYTLYAVKYINTWHGNYLRRGKDVIVGKNGNTGLNQTIVRHKATVESDEIKSLKTNTLTKVEFPLIFKDTQGQNINCTLILNFDQSGNCTVSAATANFTASGSGKFVKKGEKNSWGSKDRDGLYLQYEIDLAQMHVSSVDTLVARDRGVTMETFSPVSK